MYDVYIVLRMYNVNTFQMPDLIYFFLIIIVKL